jgi:hypothetical protein
MERARFSLGRQAPAHERTLIPSTLREMEGLQGQQPCARSISLFLYNLCCVSSHYVSRTHPPTLRRPFCPRARHAMLCDHVTEEV